jgi:hypothetical protein
MEKPRTLSARWVSRSLLSLHVYPPSLRPTPPHNPGGTRASPTAAPAPPGRGTWTFGEFSPGRICRSATRGRCSPRIEKQSATRSPKVCLTRPGFLFLVCAFPKWRRVISFMIDPSTFDLQLSGKWMRPGVHGEGHTIVSTKSSTCPNPGARDMELEV